jgi:hypothetical protein
MSLSAKLKALAVVCCIHGVEKGQYVNLVYDSARETPGECLCCKNPFAYPHSDFGTRLFCDRCTPGGGNEAL